MRFLNLCANRSDGWHCISNNTVEMRCTDGTLSRWGDFDENPYGCHRLSVQCNPDAGRCFMPLADKIFYACLATFVVVFSIISLMFVCYLRGNDATEISHEEASLETSDDGD